MAHFNMQAEVVYLLILSFILTIITLSICYIIKNYLNRKPLGMQTVLDQTVKDLIKIFVSLHVISWWIVSIKLVNKPYGCHLSLMTLLLNKFMLFSLIIQVIFIVILRYLYVFHQNILNYFEDTKVIKIARTIVVVVCMTLTLSQVENRNGIYFKILMDQHVDDEIWKQNKVPIVSIILILALLITVKQIGMKNPFS